MVIVLSGLFYFQWTMICCLVFGQFFGFSLSCQARVCIIDVEDAIVMHSAKDTSTPKESERKSGAETQA